MALFIMQLLSFLLRVGLYSKNLSQGSLLATGDQILQSYQSKSYSFVDFCLYRFWRNCEINLNFRSKRLFFHLDKYLSGCALKQIWFEYNQNSNLSTNSIKGRQYPNTMPSHCALYTWGICPAPVNSDNIL